MKPFVKQVYNEQSITADADTGEVLDVSVKTRTILVDNEKQFMQIFYHIEGMMQNITGFELKVFMHLCLSANKDNVVSTSMYFRKDIATKLNSETTGVKKSSPASVANAISSLAKQKIIVALSKGTFRINPQFVWKSDSGSRTKTLKYFLEVECKTVN